VNTLRLLPVVILGCAAASGVAPAGAPSPRSSASAPGACAVDADCRLAHEYTCGELVSCTSSCQGAGHDVAYAVHDPPAQMPTCGSQPPCTPMCPASALPPVPIGHDGAVVPAGPRAACVHGRCGVVQH